MEMQTRKPVEAEAGSTVQVGSSGVVLAQGLAKAKAMPAL